MLKLCTLLLLLIVPAVVLGQALDVRSCKSMVLETLRIETQSNELFVS